MGLQTTAYAPLMAGSQNGPVVVPGNPDASKLWEMVGQGKMPATGPLPTDEQQLVREWIAQGAAEHRAQLCRRTSRTGRRWRKHLVHAGRSQVGGRQGRL